MGSSYEGSSQTPQAAPESFGSSETEDPLSDPAPKGFFGRLLSVLTPGSDGQSSESPTAEAVSASGPAMPGLASLRRLRVDDPLRIAQDSQSQRIRAQRVGPLA